MAHHSKDKVFKKIIKKYPQEFLKYLGLDYEFIKMLDTTVFNSAGDESRLDILMHVKYKGNMKNHFIEKGVCDENEVMNFSELADLLLDIEIQSTLISEYLIKRTHNYCSKTHMEHNITVKPLIISTIEPKSKTITRNIIDGEKFTIEVISLTEKDADKRLNKITEKVENNEELNPYDIFDLVFLQFMTSGTYSQAELYGLSQRLVKQANMNPEDKQEVIDLLYLYLEDTIKLEEYDIVRGDLMTGVRSRYIQDEKNQSKEEGIKIGEERGEKRGEEKLMKKVVNLLNESKDLNEFKELLNAS